MNKDKDKGICATICIGREMLCVPCAGFLFTLPSPLLPPHPLLPSLPPHLPSPPLTHYYIRSDILKVDFFAWSKLEFWSFAQEKMQKSHQKNHIICVNHDNHHHHHHHHHHRHHQCRPWSSWSKRKWSNPSQTCLTIVSLGNNGQLRKGSLKKHFIHKKKDHGLTHALPTRCLKEYQNCIISLKVTLKGWSFPIGGVALWRGQPTGGFSIFVRPSVHLSAR